MGPRQTLLRASDARPARAQPHRDFVESLWDDDGGFRGHPSDPVTDCEYTFYGLLAMGHVTEARRILETCDNIIVTREQPPTDGFAPVNRRPGTQFVE